MPALRRSSARETRRGWPKHLWDVIGRRCCPSCGDGIATQIPAQLSTKVGRGKSLLVGWRRRSDRSATASSLFPPVSGFPACQLIAMARNQQSRLSDGTIQNLEACSITVTIIMVCLAFNSLVTYWSGILKARRDKRIFTLKIHFAGIMKVNKNLHHSPIQTPKSCHVKCVAFSLHAEIPAPSTSCERWRSETIIQNMRWRVIPELVSATFHSVDLQSPNTLQVQVASVALSTYGMDHAPFSL